MKYRIALPMILIIIALATPGHSFVNYLFGGSSDHAVGNSVVGDFRSWWSGNPVYQFDPFYSSKGVPQQVVRQPPPSSLNMNQSRGASVQYGPGNYQYQRSVPYPQANAGSPPPQVYPGQQPAQRYQAPAARYGPPPAQQYQQPPGQTQYYQQGYGTTQPQGYPGNAGYR